MCCQPTLYFFSAFVALLAIILLLANKLRHYMHLSETDTLTALPNYRGFLKKLGIQMRAKNNLCVAILDIDGFSRFNNESYALGDMVLQHFARFLKSELPEGVFLARFRLGDEFILTIPHTLESANATMLNIAEKIKSQSFTNGRSEKYYTLNFSYGLAAFTPEGDAMDALLQKAEKALMENKKMKQA